ncbi:DMT family transporter [Gulbenkiania mobilis]|uniref:DMT family transporter n=1 Tax=Gulbenkiania mobilis TaxID=397457 RepID=UPI0006BBECD4|nr:DMT family transporter [Gulbenkiania mobilis]
MNLTSSPVSPEAAPGSRLGAGWMVVASVLFGLMGYCVKLASSDFSPIELVLWRTLFGVALLGPLAAVRRARFRTPHWRAHLGRSLTGYLALLLNFYAIAHLPLATAVTLNYTSPLFLAVLSVVALRERLTTQATAALALGFAGVVLLLRPTFAADAWLAGVMGLGAGFLAGWAYLHVRELGRLGEPEWRTVFYFALVSSVGGLVLMAFNDWHPVNAHNVWPLAGIGLTATLAQLAMTRAYKVGRKMLAASLSYLTVVFSSLIGIFAWNDPLSPGLLGGMALIVVSGIVASRR